MDRPLHGVKFRRAESNQCDLCRSYRRNPRPQPWLGYGVSLGKAAFAESFKWKRVTSKSDYLRHDGHFPVQPRKKVVNFVKQYRRDPHRLGDFKPPDTTEYQGDNDLRIATLPTCGTDCSKRRADIMKAVSELMAHEPEVLRIRPRTRPPELELPQLESFPSLPTTQSEPSPTLEGPDKIDIELEVAAPATIVEQNTNVVTLLVPQPRTAASPAHETVASPISTSQADPPVTATHPEAPSATQPPTVKYPAHKIVQWAELPRDSLCLYGELKDTPEEGSSSLQHEAMQTIRESTFYNFPAEMGRNWKRNEKNSSPLYQEMVAKAHEPRDFWSVSNLEKMRSREKRVGDMHVQKGKGDARKDEEKPLLPKHLGEPVEVKLKLTSILEQSSIGNEVMVDDHHQSQETGGDKGDLRKEADPSAITIGETSGAQKLRTEADANQKGKSIDLQEEKQHQLLNSCLSPTELDYMKAAILSHNFYPRLVTSVIEQHKAGAPPELVAKLEKVRWRVLQSWNPCSSAERQTHGEDKIRRYQEILTKFEKELEKPFQKAIDFSWQMEHILNNTTRLRGRSEDGQSSASATTPDCKEENDEPLAMSA